MVVALVRTRVTTVVVVAPLKRRQPQRRCAHLHQGLRHQRRRCRCQHHKRLERQQHYQQHHYHYHCHYHYQQHHHHCQQQQQQLPLVLLLLLSGIRTNSEGSSQATSVPFQPSRRSFNRSPSVVSEVSCFSARTASSTEKWGSPSAPSGSLTAAKQP